MKHALMLGVLLWQFGSNSIPVLDPFIMDVPAIQETTEQEYGNTGWCNSCNQDKNFGGMTVCTAMSCDPHAKHEVTRWTCADKTRILLTSESDEKHCVKFK